MRISEMLYAIASWLESPNNEALLLAEYDEDCLQVVATSCIQAADLLKTAADHVDVLEPEEESKITPESLEQLANIATAFDSSGDEELKKQASVIDELLLTIAAPVGEVSSKKASEDKRIEELKKKYQNANKELDEINKISDVKSAIEKSNIMKEVKTNDQPLSTRYCPDHSGAQMSRVGEHEFQCELDKKIYNFENGFTLNNGTKVPGGSVDLQTTTENIPYYTIFDTRESRNGSQ